MYTPCTWHLAMNEAAGLWVLQPRYWHLQFRYCKPAKGLKLDLGRAQFFELVEVCTQSAKQVASACHWHPHLSTIIYCQIPSYNHTWFCTDTRIQRMIDWKCGYGLLPAIRIQTHSNAWTGDWRKEGRSLSCMLTQGEQARRPSLLALIGQSESGDILWSLYLLPSRASLFTSLSKEEMFLLNRRSL